MKKIMFLGLLMISVNAFSQQDSQFTQYFDKTLHVNPAYAGSSGMLSATDLQAVFVKLEVGVAYHVELNGVLARVCGGRSLQLVSPRAAVSSPLDDVRRSVAYMKVGDLTIEEFPLAKVKKGEVLGTATLVTDVERWPFNVELKGATISDALVRINGTWTMTISWSSCINVPRR